MAKRTTGQENTNTHQDGKGTGISHDTAPGQEKHCGDGDRADAPPIAHSVDRTPRSLKIRDQSGRVPTTQPTGPVNPKLHPAGKGHTEDSWYWQGLT